MVDWSGRHSAVIPSRSDNPGIWRMMRTTIKVLLIVMLVCGLFRASFALDRADETAPYSERPLIFKQEPVVSTGAASRVALVTLLAIGMAVGGAWLIRRYLRTKGMILTGEDGRITVKETRRVSNRLTLFLIAIDDQEYLVTQTGDKTTVARHSSPPLD